MRNFFEELDAHITKLEDCDVTRLILGWHASFVLTRDNKFGVGFVPDSLKEAHTARPVHTQALNKSSLKELAALYVSPFPQEFAAASAAVSALLPFKDNNSRLDLIMPLARGDKVAVLGYDRELIPFMREWGWRVAVFDDRFAGRQDCFTLDEFPRGVREAEWVWLTPEAIRDRRLLSNQHELLNKKGCFLQGPGIPALPEIFKNLGVTHLAAPILNHNTCELIEAHIAAGGSPWLSEDILWRVYCCQSF
ncbi:MAG: hypothetical protein IJ520_12385 [Synergistaceae bacterium]|nr:hypothetical protein [Synergistaceae bacterium]